MKLLFFAGLKVAKKKDKGIILAKKMK